MIYDFFFLLLQESIAPIPIFFGITRRDLVLSLGGIEGLNPNVILFIFGKYSQKKEEENDFHVFQYGKF